MFSSYIFFLQLSSLFQERAENGMNCNNIVTLQIEKAVKYLGTSSGEAP